MNAPKSKHPPAGVDDTRGLKLIANSGYLDTYKLLQGAPRGSLTEKQLGRFDSLIVKAERGERLDKQDVALLKKLREKL